MRNDAIVKSFVVRGAMLLVIAGATAGIGEQGTSVRAISRRRAFLQSKQQSAASSANAVLARAQTRVFLIPGAGANGANVAVQVGRDGVAMVDTGSAEMRKGSGHRQIPAELRKFDSPTARLCLRNSQHDQFQ